MNSKIMMMSKPMMSDKAMNTAMTPAKVKASRVKAMIISKKAKKY